MMQKIVKRQGENEPDDEDELVLVYSMGNNCTIAVSTVKQSLKFVSTIFFLLQ